MTYIEAIELALKYREDGLIVHPAWNLICRIHSNIVRYTSEINELELEFAHRMRMKWPKSKKESQCVFIKEKRRIARIALFALLPLYRKAEIQRKLIDLRACPFHGCEDNSPHPFTHRIPIIPIR